MQPASELSVIECSLPRGLQALQGALGRLTSERAQQVLLLRTSQRYLDRMAASLLQKAGQEGKFRRWRPPG